MTASYLTITRRITQITDQISDLQAARTFLPLRNQRPALVHSQEALCYRRTYQPVADRVAGLNKEE